MNCKVYKWCAVPLCKNTSISNPNKLFVYVPNQKIMRDKWLKLARRNPQDVVAKSSIYFCEDHFDLPNDMENYMQYHLMGSVSKVLMKKGCVPRKFECQNMPSHPSKKFKKKLSKEDQSDSDTSYSLSITHPESKSLLIEYGSVCSNIIEDEKKQEASRILGFTIEKITVNPSFSTGIPNSCYYLIDLIHEHTNIPTNHILLCLKKIRLNNSFLELAHEFAMDETYANKIFFKTVPILASLIRPFIFSLSNELNLKNLPRGFRHKCYQISCIIKCIEIEIQKPSSALNQALTWSDYKKTNTIKYLVSCTPNGLINYISPGYGGRISNTCLVESCDFIKCLEPGMYVMADRGFNYVDVYLRNNGVIFVQPPSVAPGSQLSKTEVREMKPIAISRIHMECVIGRLQHFHMIKPHACHNMDLVKVLDDVLTIACGLINLQYRIDTF